MTDLIITPSGPLAGAVSVPGDKSITHRAILLGALAPGDTLVRGWVPAEVCLATLRCVRALGVQVEETGRWGDGETGRRGDGERGSPCLRVSVSPSLREGGGPLLIHGAGLHGLREPADVLDCAGSGTTMRLLAGLLAGQPFCSVLTGSEALRRRPMARIAEPLRLMGATVLGREDGRLAPLAIRGGKLRGIDYTMPVASAQVKSAILLAGLFAEGETVIHEPGPSRDHTERMLAAFGVEVVSGKSGTVRLRGGQRPQMSPSPGRIELMVPGDFSSAAFPLVAATLVPGSEVRLIGVGVNPTRTGLYDLLAEMANPRHFEPRCTGFETGRAPLRGVGEGERGRGSPCLRLTLSPALQEGGEPMADLDVCSSELRGIEVGGEAVVRAIDEFPVFAVAATQAHGTTIIREAEELRVKESDRIATVATELRKMGARIEERPDGMVIHGPTPLNGAVVECHRDHRLAMALAVAGLVASGETIVEGAEAIGDSFPGFVETMQALGARIAWRT